MTVTVRYYTRSGNTERLAKAVAEALGVQAKGVNVPLTEKADILFLGCSYYAFDIDEEVKKFILLNKDNIGKVVCIGTSAMMKSMHKPVRKLTDQAGVELATEEFHCRGAFGPMHQGRPNEEDLKKAAEFARAVMQK